MRRLLIYLSLLFFLILTVECNRETRYQQCDGMVWNTTYHIVFQGNGSLQDSILKVFNEIETSVSQFREGSVVSNINANLSDSVDQHFINVYEACKKINKASNGMFDPTLAPLITAWGFGKGHTATSDTLRLDSLLQLVGIGKTTLRGNRLLKENPGIQFNFSAIAKGYGVDCVADMLKRNGVENFLVEIGGEIMTAGVNREGNKWSVAVDKPIKDADNPNHESIMTLYVSGQGIATSGNYRNYHTLSSGSYGHTISPVTGRPIESDVISATVVANTTMEADALATASMALGSEEAMNLCNSLGCGVMLVLRDFSTVSNHLFSNYTIPGIE